MRRRVEAAGMLRRATDPEVSIVVELFTTAAERFACDSCGGKLQVGEPADDDWPESRRCEVCQQTIPAARLEALPQAIHCAGCQEKIDRGEAVGEREFCDFCGGVMQLRLASSGSRYVSRCSDCGR